LRAKMILGGIAFMLVISLNLLHRSGNRTNAPFDEATQRIVLKLVATVPIPPTVGEFTVHLVSSTSELYLTDPVSGRIQKANWKTGARGDWVALDSSRCLAPDTHIYSMKIMKTTPYLLVLNCHRLELLAKSTLAPIRYIAENEDDSVDGFALSLDQRFLSVNVNRQGKHTTRTYRTNDWKILHEWNIEDAYFSPNGLSLVANFARAKNATSYTGDECGFRFYDANSGQKTSEFVRSAERNDDVCPNGPGYVVPGHPNLLVTDDALRPAVSEWDLSNGKLVQHLESRAVEPGPAPGLESLAISSNGELAMVVRSRREWGMEWGITIWDLTDGEKAYEVPLGRQAAPVMAASFSQDGNYLAFVYSNRVDIYDYKTP